MPYLRLYHPGGAREIFVIQKKVTSVGSGRKVDLQIQAPDISENHFSIREDRGHYFIKDLNSNTGTYLNDENLIGEKRLGPSDQVRAGKVRLFFFQETESAREDAEPTKDAVTIMHEAEELALSLMNLDYRHAEPSARTNLDALQKIGEEIADIRDEPTFNQLFADRVREIFHADRCAIAYPGYREAGVELEIRAISSGKSGNGDEIVISRTVLHHVMEEKMALTLTDARSDNRFATRKSIVLSNIYSVLCAPIWHKEKIFGLIYLDTVGRMGNFDRDHLSLLSAIGNIAAVKIENFHLSERSTQISGIAPRIPPEADTPALLLPPDELHFPHITCVGHLTAGGEPGGDYYDCTRIDHDTLAITMASSTFRGVEGMMTISVCKGFLRALEIAGLSLEQRVTELNRFLAGLHGPKWQVTLFSGEVDMETGTMMYINAGHPAPILMGPSGGTSLLTSMAPPLGEDLFTVEVRATELSPGGKLLLHTEGVVNCITKEEIPFGVKRLLQVFSSLGPVSALETRNRIVSELRQNCPANRMERNALLAIIMRKSQEHPQY